jgi:hypothetical protein
MSNDGEVIGGACVSDAGVPVVILSSASKWIEFDSSCGFMEWRMSADDAFTLSNLLINQGCAGDEDGSRRKGRE